MRVLIKAAGSKRMEKAVEETVPAATGTAAAAGISTAPAVEGDRTAEATALPLWTKHFSKTHNTYYWFNNADGTSSWTMPAEESNAETVSKQDGTHVPTKRVADSGSNGDSTQEAHQNKRGRLNNSDSIASSSSRGETEYVSRYRPFVAILVPFRDLHRLQNREAHLKRFVPHMTEFLSQSSLPFRIYIVEQSDDQRKFNRGKLLNIGFRIAKKDGCQVFVFHDVDLLPSKELLPYYTTVPDRNPVHVARVWNRYSNNPKYFGGVNAFSAPLFENMNGFPNNFWGWGGEDDELFKRSVEVTTIKKG
jgi:hypothetical protein